MFEETKKPLKLIKNFFFFSKHRKSRVLSTVTTEFGRSISVPADRMISKSISPNHNPNTPTTPELEYVLLTHKYKQNFKLFCNTKHICKLYIFVFDWHFYCFTTNTTYKFKKKKSNEIKSIKNG